MGEIPQISCGMACTFLRYQTAIRRMYGRSYVQNTIATMIMLSFVATSVENQFISTIEKGDSNYYIFKGLNIFFTVITTNIAFF